MTLLIVRGQVQREVAPDHARVDVEIVAGHRDRAALLSALESRSAQLSALLDGYAGAVHRRDTTAFTVRPARTVKDEPTEGFDGRLRTTLTVTDLTAVPELMRALAGLDGVTVEGPWWGLRSVGGAQRQARADAVADALARAREYADALGSRLVEMVQLSDADGGGAIPFAAAAADAGAFGLEPVPQTVYASVEARFEITPPPLD